MDQAYQEDAKAKDAPPAYDKIFAKPVIQTIENKTQPNENMKKCFNNNLICFFFVLRIKKAKREMRTV